MEIIITDHINLKITTTIDKPSVGYGSLLCPYDVVINKPVYVSSFLKHKEYYTKATNKGCFVRFHEIISQNQTEFLAVEYESAILLLIKSNYNPDPKICINLLTRARILDRIDNNYEIRLAILYDVYQ